MLDITELLAVLMKKRFVLLSFFLFFFIAYRKKSRNLERVETRGNSRRVFVYVARSELLTDVRHQRRVATFSHGRD